MKVRELLKTEKNWCQGHFCYHNGKEVEISEVVPENLQDYRFCLFGAVRYCYNLGKTQEVARDICRKITLGVYIILE